MPIYFSNPGVIDLEAALTLGVNAKENSSPIGQFGTGLKYAIAVLLRTGHKVTIFAGGQIFSFSTEAKSTRGVAYDLVLCNGKPLGFTTALGKHWKVWQAFRELYSNAMDEHGKVYDLRPQGDTLTSTTIEVSGQEISQVFCDRWKYFLPAGQPLASFSNVEIFYGRGIYYKGILVDESKTCWAYNLTSGLTLTEDRTIGNTWSVHYDIAHAIQAQLDPKFLSTILSATLAPEHDYPWGTDFSDPSRALLRQKAAREQLPPKFKGIADGLAVQEGTIETRPASAQESSMLALAVEQLSFLGVEVTHPILLSDKLPVTYLGLAKAGKIFLAGSLFAQGQTKVTGTLLEEHLHCALGFSDMTRRFQNHLFDMLANAAAQLSLSPLERYSLPGAGPYDQHAPIGDEIPF
jgi:hypothetical protein